MTIKVYIQALKTELAVQARWDGDHIGLRVMPAMFADAGGAGASLSFPDIPLDNPVDAIKWVLSELRRRINKRITGKGTALGDPRLRVGEVVNLTGLGDRASAAPTTASPASPTASTDQATAPSSKFDRS